MTSDVAITFVSKDDFRFEKLPRTARFVDVRRAWERKSDPPYSLHFFHLGTHNGPILQEEGVLSQLLEPRDCALIFYVYIKEYQMKEAVERWGQPELREGVDRIIQTFPVDVFRKDLFCPSRCLEDLAFSSFMDNAGIYKSSSANDMLLLFSFIGSDVRSCRWLIEVHGAVATTTGLDGTTPLHYAALNGHEKIARLLIEKGCEVDARDKRKTTPLMMAAQKGRFKVMRLLIDADADIEACDYAGMRPLMFASWSGHEPCVQWLLRYAPMIDAKAQNGWTSLMRSCSRGYLSTTLALLMGGARVDVLNTRDRTAMIVAVRQDQFSVVRLLAEYRTNLDAHHAREALQSAVEVGNSEIYDFLKEMLPAD